MRWSIVSTSTMHVRCIRCCSANVWSVADRRLAKGLSSKLKPGVRVAVALSKSKSPLDTRSNLPELREFLIYLASERGLADNTLQAYRRDLEDLCDYFIKIKRSPLKASADDYRAYLQDQSRQ